jgi:hypothetical protein
VYAPRRILLIRVVIFLESDVLQTLSRIANWGEMSEIERQRTLRILVRRNQLSYDLTFWFTLYISLRDVGRIRLEDQRTKATEGDQADVEEK